LAVGNYRLAIPPNSSTTQHYFPIALHMAYKNKTIHNPRTRHEIRFVQTAGDTDGELLEIVATYHAHSKEPAPHYHPYQTEDFEVLEGELTVRIDNGVRVLKPGEKLHIPKNKVHSMWNNSEGITIVNWQVRPAMNTENFLETAVGLANDGKTNVEGMPNILQVSLMANQYADVFRLARPPFIIQKMVFLALTPFAYLAGYRPTYKQYIE